MGDMGYRWAGHEFSSGVVAGEDYMIFQREMRADLKKQAAENGLSLVKYPDP